jgi:hypothetical protein
LKYIFIDILLRVRRRTILLRYSMENSLQALGGTSSSEPVTKRHRGPNSVSSVVSRINDEQMKLLSCAAEISLEEYKGQVDDSGFLVADDKISTLQLEEFTTCLHHQKAAEMKLNDLFLVPQEIPKRRAAADCLFMLRSNVIVLRLDHVPTEKSPYIMFTAVGSTPANLLTAFPLFHTFQIRDSGVLLLTMTGKGLDALLRCVAEAADAVAAPEIATPTAGKFASVAALSSSAGSHEVATTKEAYWFVDLDGNRWQCNRKNGRSLIQLVQSYLRAAPHLAVRFLVDLEFNPDYFWKCFLLAYGNGLVTSPPARYRGFTMFHTVRDSPVCLDPTLFKQAILGDWRTDNWAFSMTSFLDANDRMFCWDQYHSIEGVGVLARGLTKFGLFCACFMDPQFLPAWNKLADFLRMEEAVCVWYGDQYLFYQIHMLQCRFWGDMAQEIVSTAYGDLPMNTVTACVEVLDTAIMACITAMRRGTDPNWEKVPHHLFYSPQGAFNRITTGPVLSSAPSGNAGSGLPTALRGRPLNASTSRSAASGGVKKLCIFHVAQCLKVKRDSGDLVKCDKGSGCTNLHPVLSTITKASALQCLQDMRLGKALKAVITTAVQVSTGMG